MANIDNLNFRTMFHRVCFIEMNNWIKHVMTESGFTGEDVGNGILAYGYIDYEAGFTFEVLSWGYRGYNGDVSAVGMRAPISMKIRRASLSGCEIAVFDRDLYPQFETIMDMVDEAYAPSEGVAITRGITLIDAQRNADYPDDVLVYLYEKGNEIEGVWVRCTSMGEDCVNGILLNEPSQDFEMHQGDDICFKIMEEEPEKYSCVAVFKE